MAEYIDREAIIDLITKRYENPEICIHEINAIPAADVAPVVHGEWMRHRNILWHYCSICLEDALMSRSTGTEVLSGTCPHCGARMDGKGGEQNAAD